MSMCDDISDKVVFFEDLSLEEQESVRKHTDQCADCRKKLAEFQTILVSIRHYQNEHVISDELLERYSIHLTVPEEVEYGGRKLTATEISRIRAHLVECKHCREKIEQLQEEYQAIKTYLEETELASLSLNAETGTFVALSERIFDFLKMVNYRIFSPSPRIYPIAAGAFAVLLVLLWFGPFFRSSDNPYIHLLSLEDEKISTATRGNVPEPLSQGIYNYLKGNYPQAIIYLEQFITESSDNRLLSQAHLTAGIVYLNEAKTDFLGRFVKYDISLIDKGIQHLNKALDLNNNLGFLEDCHWYLGKAYLLKNDDKTAKLYFSNIVELHGRRFGEAQEIVKEIEDIISQQKRINP